MPERVSGDSSSLFFKGNEMDEMIGKKFGRWTVIEVLPRERGAKRMKPLKYKCLCDCGNTGEVNKTCLVTGRSLSCGCYVRQKCSETMTTHGLSRTPLYALWSSIKRRVANPNTKSFVRYGARGIVLCDEWANDFQSFYDYVNGTLGPKPTPQHSLDRIENEGNYEPGNIQWATSEAQSSNRSSNIVVVYQGISDTLTRHCKRLGLNPKAVNLRVSRRGWTPEQALSTPTDGRRHERPKQSQYQPTMSLADQCAARGRNYSTVKGRILMGWSTEEALSAPTDGKKHRRPVAESVEEPVEEPV